MPTPNQAEHAVPDATSGENICTSMQASNVAISIVNVEAVYFGRSTLLKSRESTGVLFLALMQAYVAL
jgi:hypothetical protein